MSRLSLHGCALLALLCVLLSSFEPAPAQTRPALETDARLDKKLTTRAAGIPLKALLQDWSKQSGVSLAADATIAEYRAFALLKDRSLRDSMRLLAQAFGFEWRAEPDKPNAPRYVLHAPSAALQQQRALLQLLTANPSETIRRVVQSAPQELFNLSYEDYCRALGALPTDERFAQPVDAPVAQPSPASQYAKLLDTAHAPRDSVERQFEFALRRALLLECASSPEFWLALHALRRAPANASGEFKLSLAPEAAFAQYRRARASLNTLLESAQAAESAEAPPAGEPEPIPPWKASEMIAPREPISPDATVALCYDERERALVIRLTPSLSESLILPIERLLWNLYTEPRESSEDEELALVLQRAAMELELPNDETPPAQWLRELTSRWYAWFAYALVDALEQAKLEGVGEFYPISEPPNADLPTADAVSIENADAMHRRITQLYDYRRVNECYVFTARARVLARILDLSDSALAPYIGKQSLELERAAHLANRLTRAQLICLSQQLPAAQSLCLQRDYDLERALPVEALQYAYTNLIDSYALVRWYGQLSPLSRQLLAQGAPVPLRDLRPNERNALQAIEYPCTDRPVYLTTLQADDARIQLRLWRNLKDPRDESRRLRVWQFILDTETNPHPAPDNPFYGALQYAILAR
ncbi:MAG: hypothetical protein NZM28_10360 [Fimbriimonadales bacterium]|nr:hypothetical protein [Fimbriimonadales bacterium]